MLNPALLKWFPPIYKFMNKRYLDGFLKSGIIKIGTSAEYRVSDGLDDGRSDRNEMVDVWKPGESTTEVDDNHPFIKDLYKDRGGPSWKGKFNIKFSEEGGLAMQPDAFLFSASCEYNDALAQQMREKFDADACVLIEDTRAFIVGLCNTPLLQGRDCEAGMVSYQHSNESKSYVRDSMRKLKKFEWQREFRTTWGGDDVPKVGTIITVPEIVPLLSKFR